MSLDEFVPKILEYVVTLEFDQKCRIMKQWILFVMSASIPQKLLS